MSFFLMMLIASIYGAAAVGYAFEGKLGWMTVALCWGVGNAVIAWMSR
jgi:hypothetical protein